MFNFTPWSVALIAEKGHPVPIAYEAGLATETMWILWGLKQYFVPARTENLSFILQFKCSHSTD
jgi:hypothetical protein